MDNDDLRRGRPTCHRAFDEATAILAGDSLQVLAFSLLATHAGLAGRAGDPRAPDRASRSGERHSRHGRRTGARSGGPGSQAQPGRRSSSAPAQDRRADPRLRADGRGLRSGPHDRAARGARRVRQPRRPGLSDPGRHPGCRRRCERARQGHGRRSRARQAHLSRRRRHRRRAARACASCTSPPMQLLGDSGWAGSAAGGVLRLAAAPGGTSMPCV